VLRDLQLAVLVLLVLQDVLDREESIVWVESLLSRQLLTR